jgi:hypothetical protein
MTTQKSSASPAHRTTRHHRVDERFLEVLERLRRRYPEAMFDTEEELLAAATDRAADERIYGAAVVWRMERESELA